MTENNISIFKTKKITRSGDDIVEEEMINEKLAHRYLDILERNADNEKRKLELEKKRWWVPLLSITIGVVTQVALAKFRTPRMENLGTDMAVQQIEKQARSQFMNYETS